LCGKLQGLTKNHDIDSFSQARDLNRIFKILQRPPFHYCYCEFHTTLVDTWYIDFVSPKDHGSIMAKESRIPFYQYLLRFYMTCTYFQFQNFIVHSFPHCTCGFEMYSKTEKS
jgi:hypothetical protein